MNKRGLSTVITTLIIVLMSLVAVGIIWIVVQNITQSGSESIDYSSKCLVTDVKVESVKYVPKTLPVMTNSEKAIVLLSRATTGGEEIAIGGVRLTFTQPGGTTINGTRIGDMLVLSTQSYTSGVLTAKPTKVTATVYFTKDDGTPYICPSGNSLEVIETATCTDTEIGGSCKVTCTAGIETEVTGVAGCSGTTPKCCKYSG